MTKPAAQILTALRSALGLTLLLLAVSTDFEFREAATVEIHVFEDVTATFIVPALVALAVKAALAFSGSYLLLRRTQG